MLYGTIYCITNNANGKQYVGQTIQKVDARWKEHVNHSKHYDFPLYRAINKYGVDKFSIRVIDTAASEQELNEKETKYINSLKTLCPNGYNAMLGQPGNAKEICAETREKLTKGLIKRWEDPNYRRKMKQSTTGKKRKPITDEHRANLSESHKGKRLSESQKEKIGAASKKLWQDQKYAAKALKGLYNAIKSQERPVINIDTGRSYCSATQAARELNLYQQNITKCCQGSRKRTGGYRWKYQETEVMENAI